MANILILNKDQSMPDEIVASNALSAMLKALGHTVSLSTVQTQQGAFPAEISHVFFYPELMNAGAMQTMIEQHPEMRFIMTTASTKDRSLNPNSDEHNELANVSYLPRPFSVDTLKVLVN